jgi:hypothetical protein
VVAGAVRVVEAERPGAESARELFRDGDGFGSAPGDGRTDAVENVRLLRAGEGLQRVDAEVDVVQRSGAGDVAEERGVRPGGARGGRGSFSSGWG